MLDKPTRERVDAMTREGKLTERQAEVAQLLAEGHTAREVAGIIGITRNAVYQQIQAMKRKGLFGEDYTPSGEIRMPAGRAHQVLSEITEPTNHVSEPTPAHMQVIQELVAQNRALVDIIANMQREGG